MAVIENFRAEPEHIPGDDFLGNPKDEDKDADDKEHQFDSEENKELHTRLIRFLMQEIDRQGENRSQIAQDHDYYDHIQLTAEQAQELKDRGQAPTVYNRIATVINWIIGTEKRSAVDFQILGRTKDDVKPAERKSEYLKYLSDCNRTQFNRSRAFKDAAIGGIGWQEDGVTDAFDGEPLYSKYVNWREILDDSCSYEYDQSDSRYLFRMKWLDVDLAKSIWDDRTEVIDAAIAEGGALGSSILFTADDPFDRREQENLFGYTGYIGGERSHTRQRVRIIECWYRVPAKVQKIKGGTFHGQVYDPNNHEHVSHVECGLCEVVERIQMTVRYALMTTKGLLDEGASPYRHDRFPYTKLICYRRDRDGQYYGIVRGIRDPQDAYNKRISKSLFILSTNKVIMEEGAVKDIDEFREEVSRPDAIIVKRKGAELTLNTDRDLSAAHLQLAAQDAEMIQMVSGITDENMGRETNARSGKAIQARQSQGALATAELFDNLRLTVQLQGEIQLSNVEQFVTEQKMFRITDQKGNTEFKSMNDGLPENDIAHTKADFIVAQQDFRETMRMAQTEMLFDLVGKLPPEVGLQMLDLVVDLMDIKNKDEIVARLRKINGQRDPDAELSEQEKAEAAKAAQAQEAQQQLQIRGVTAEISIKEAQAQKLQAEAQSESIRAQQPDGEADKVRLQMQAQIDLLRKQLVDQASAYDMSKQRLQAQFESELAAVNNNIQSDVIKAEAMIEVARIKAESDSKIDELDQKIAEVTKHIESLGGDAEEESEPQSVKDAEGESGNSEQREL